MREFKLTAAPIAVILGSDSDESKVQPALAILEELGLSYELSILSSHRNPKDLAAYIEYLRSSVVRVVICVAGMAAQLPGEVAAKLKGTSMQVIGVPLSSSNFPDAMDALLSCVRMPPGVPLVCAGIDTPGAINAVLFAASIILHDNQALQGRLDECYAAMAEKKGSKPQYKIFDPNGTEKGEA